MRFRLMHLLLLSSFVCVGLAIPNWLHPVEFFVFIPLLAFTVMTVERRQALVPPPAMAGRIGFLILRAIAGAVVALIAVFGLATVALTISYTLPQLGLGYIDTERTAGFWMCYGAVVAVAYHVTSLIKQSTDESPGRRS